MAGAHIGELRVLGPDVLGLGLQLDAVRLHHVGQDDLVPPLLIRVHRQRLVQHGIADELGVGPHVHARAPLRLHGDVPDRQGDDALARLLVEQPFARDGGLRKAVGERRQLIAIAIARRGAGIAITGGGMGVDFG